MWTRTSKGKSKCAIFLINLGQCLSIILLVTKFGFDKNESEKYNPYKVFFVQNLEILQKTNKREFKCLCKYL